MPEQYAPDVQKQLSDAEASLDSALSQMKAPQEEFSKEETNEPENEPQRPEREEQTNDAPKKKGADFVDIKDPEIKDRVNYLYLQAKSADEKNKLLLEQNKKLQEKLEGLSKDVSSIKNDTRQKQEDFEIKNIKSQLKEAWAVGDFDRAADLNDNLVQLAAEQQRRLLMEVSKAEETKPKETIPEMDQRSRQDAQFIDFLAKEKDSQGNLMRPYLNEWHPENNRAANEAAKIATEFAQAGRQTTIAEIMRELDRRMKPSNPASSDNVLTSSRNDQSPKKTSDLSAEERTMARKMGISEKDWAMQKELLRRERRA